MASVRASYCKGAVAAAKQHPFADELLAGFAPARPEVRAAGMIGWVEASVFSILTASTMRALGADGSREFWADRLLDAFARPLMKPLVRGGQRLFGRSPAGILRMTPQGYALTFRNCGVPTVALETTSATIEISHVPRPLRNDATVECYLGHCLAALRFAEAEGDVHADRSRLTTEGFLTLSATWPG